MAHPIAQSEADPAEQNQPESDAHQHSGAQRQFRLAHIRCRLNRLGVEQSPHTMPPNS
jgi:hypothetical protein